MHILVQALKGTTVATLDVLAGEKVQELKTKIRRKDGIPEAQQGLIFGGKMLHDGRTLAHYNIVNETMLHLIVRPGGDGFDASNHSDQLIAFLKLPEEERASIVVPHAQLQSKARVEGANLFRTFRYEEQDDVLHPQQRDLLRRFLDFLCEVTSRHAPAFWTDMCVAFKDKKLLVRLLASLDFGGRACTGESASQLAFGISAGSSRRRPWKSPT